LFIPSVVNWIIPAVIMSFTVSTDKPESVSAAANLKHGAWVVVGPLQGLGHYEGRIYVLVPIGSFAGA